MGFFDSDFVHSNFFDVKFPNIEGSEFEKMSNRHIANRIAFQEAGRKKAKTGSLLHKAGCMLYWGEGAKSSAALRFGNSDPNMILLYMRFLREELHVDDSIIHLYIICHEKNQKKINQIEDYWLKLVDLPQSQLNKTQIKVGSHTRKNEHTNGFCVIDVNRVELVQHVYGAIQEYVGFENPEWLVKGLSV